LHQKKQKAITRGVMALVELGGWSASRYITPLSSAG
jgi:hypothetical protein